MVTVQLLKSYCLPLLLYGSEAVGLSATNTHILENCINRTMYMSFGIGHHDNVQQLSQFLGLCSIRRLVECRRERFINGLIKGKKYGVVLKVMASNLCSQVFLLFFLYCVPLFVCVLLQQSCVFQSVFSCFYCNCRIVLHLMRNKVHTEHRPTLILQELKKVNALSILGQNMLDMSIFLKFDSHIRLPIIYSSSLARYQKLQEARENTELQGV